MYYVNKIIKSKRIKQAKIFIILLGILVSTFSNVLIFNNTHAVTEASSMTLDDRTQLYLEASALKGCFKYTAPNTYANPTVKISEENAKSGSWFGEKLTMYAGAKSGDVSCNSLVSSFKSKLEYPDYVGSGGFLCEFKSNRENGSKCETGNGSFISPFGSASSADDKIDDIISKKLFSDKGIVLEDAGWYVIYFNTFFNSCKPTEDSTLTKDDNTSYINVNILENGKKVSKNYAGSPKSELKSIRTDLGTGTEVKMTCADIASNMNKYIDAYIAYMGDHTAETGVTPENATLAPPGSTTDSKTTCAVDGVGWIVCPVMTFLANITDQAFSMLANNFLKTDTKLIGTDSNSATYNAWKIMRDIANVVFVIAFLVIIFSQLSSIGLDNYGIKKLLPKIIIAAILVNLSYIICQVAVDISNILGFSLKSLFDGLGSYMQTPEAADDKSVSILGCTALIGGILIGGVSLALAISVPVLISAFFALIVIVIILLARTALIVLLIVISPLAFVAYLLPNTEEYFTKWRKTFTALLLVFPIISVVFGASGLAATVIKATAENDLTKVMALGVAIIPLFIVPGLLKKAIDSAGNIGAKISGMGDSMGKRAGDSGIAKHIEGKRLDTKNRISTGNYVGKGGNFNPRNWQSRANRKFNNSTIANKLTGGYGAQRDLVRQAQDQKDIKDTVDLFNGDDTFAAAWAESGGNKDSNAYRGLSDNQKVKFNKMVSAGYHNKSSSHLAAAQFLSQEGKGTGAQVANALQSARNNGANDGDVDSATHAAIAQYRKNGRADAYAELSRSAAANHVAGAKNISNDDAWGDIPPAQLNKAALATTQNQDSYRRFLESDSENTRRALASYDNMESIAAKLALPEIVYASKVHEYNKTGVAPTITTIQQAKDHFGVR